MPVEHREVSFSLEEVETLLETYGEQFDDLIPNGCLLAMTMKGTPELNEKVLALTYRPEGTKNERRIHEMPLNHVSSCLLLYFEDNNIPLPIKAKKVLRAENNRLILRITHGNPRVSHQRPDMRLVV